MRTKLFLKNSIVILITKFLCYLAEFLCRTVLIYTLPMEYVGVTGLFSNILSVLSLSELGFGTVLVYSMYVPLAQKDEDTLLALTHFYKKAYRIITALISSIGVLLVPLLPHLISDCPDIPHLSLIYLLYLANTVLSYTFIYRQSLFLADQKLYITNFYSNLFRILKITVQIVVLVTTHNFILFLCVQLPFTLLTNLLLSHKAKKAYPFLNRKQYPDLNKEQKSEIYRNVYAMFNHRVGATVLNSTDNLLISFFLGLVEVSKNDSYAMPLNFLRYMFSPLFSALSSGIGNFHATKTKKETQMLFETLHFAGFWFYTFCTAGFFLFVNPVISLIWGDQFLFSLPVVFLLAVNFYITGIRQIPITFKESMGLLYQDRYKPIIEAFLNLLLSLLLVKPFGVIGIFVGTLISMVSTSLWVEPYVLFHYGFQCSTRVFWEKNIKYLIVGGLSLGLTYFFQLLLPPLGLAASLLVRAALCILIPNSIFILFFCRSREFRQLMDILNQFMRKRSSNPPCAPQ